MERPKNDKERAIRLQRRKDFADNVRIIIKKGYGVKLLSEVISISDQTISDWCNEKRLPKIGVVEENEKIIKEIMRHIHTFTNS